jgi:hypothetical protein
MGSGMQPGVMRAQKREIEISRVKNLLSVVFYGSGSLFYNFQQTYSKTCY